MSWTAPIAAEKEHKRWVYDIYMDHNAHVYAFLNAPLNQKKDWCRIKIAEINAIEFHGHPETYYSNMDMRRKYSAALVDKTDIQYDPMGVWFGRMSN